MQVLLATECSQDLLRSFYTVLKPFPKKVSQLLSGQKLYNISHLIGKKTIFNKGIKNIFAFIIKHSTFNNCNMSRTFLDRPDGYLQKTSYFYG